MIDSKVSNFNDLFFSILYNYILEHTLLSIKKKDCVKALNLRDIYKITFKI